MVERVEQAARFPESGRVVPEYGNPALRELFWREYRLIYRVHEDRVLVIAVVHGRRKLLDTMESE